MLLKTGVAVLGVLVAGSDSDWSMHDNFTTCMTAKGAEYVVEPPARCHLGDDEIRCRLPDGHLTFPRGQDECISKGGWPLGGLRSNRRKISN